MTAPYRIAIDVMGGDHAPQCVIEGAVSLCKEAPSSRKIFLVGLQDHIQDQLDTLGYSGSEITIVHAPEQIFMEDLPGEAVRRKRDSSIHKTLELVASGQADIAVSAGNTGAVVAAAALKLRMLPGVRRPALATCMPSPQGEFVLIDVGANSRCSAQQLLQFALMGTVYARSVLDIERPKVGLLSIGAEASKGNELTREAFALLERSGMRFVGNIEGRDLFTSMVDVVVCEGFVGNVTLKVCEGVVHALQHFMAREIAASWRSRIGGFLLRPSFRKVNRETHYVQYGGAPLLGVKGVCVVCHGSSTAEAIKNAIMGGEAIVDLNLNAAITSMIQESRS